MQIDAEVSQDTNVPKEKNRGCKENSRLDECARWMSVQGVAGKVQAVSGYLQKW